MNPDNIINVFLCFSFFIIILIKIDDKMQAEKKSGRLN